MAVSTEMSEKLKQRQDVAAKCWYSYQQAVISCWIKKQNRAAEK